MPAKRSPGEARSRKKAVAPIFKLDLGLDLELDFDPDDFDLTDSAGRPKKPKGERHRDSKR